MVPRSWLILGDIQSYMKLSKPDNPKTKMKVGWNSSDRYSEIEKNRKHSHNYEPPYNLPHYCDIYIYKIYTYILI